MSSCVQAVEGGGYYMVIYNLNNAMCLYNGDPEDAADIESTLARPLSVSY